MSDLNDNKKNEHRKNNAQHVSKFGLAIFDTKHNSIVTLSVYYFIKNNEPLMCLSLDVEVGKGGLLYRHYSLGSS